MNLPVTDMRATVHVAQGDHALGRDPETIIGTILGSCVSACLWDPEAHIGGMNHIVLPERTGAWNTIDRHGASDMERLINALLGEGASRSRLRAKVFGGANMIAGLPDIGRRNADFIHAFLAREGIPLDGSSLGGNQARMIRFWPYSGRVRQRLVDRAEEPPQPPTRAVGNDVELF